MRRPPGGCRRSVKPFRPGTGAFIASEIAADLAALRDLAEAGRLVPAIDRTYPLSEAAAAIAHVHAGRARGKVVIRV